MAWKVCQFVQQPYLNVEKIFPTNQHAVELLVNHAKENPKITRLVIFGSSVRCTCNPWSDVDCFVEGCSRDEWKHISLPDYQSLDLIFADEVTIREQVYRDILEEGVTVYVKDSA